MSRRKSECCEKETNTCSGFGNMLGNCCCDFPTLIILILIILQFNRRGGGFFGPVAPIVSADNGDCGTGAPVAQPILGGFNLIDNSILFIIALFFLSCCNPCRK